MSTPIKLTDIFQIPEPTQYKLHLACANQEGTHPLNEYVADRANWIAWNEWRGDKNDWTRRYIFSFMEFYPIRDAYLFGGVFEVKERLPDRYVISEIEAYKKWEGRLICRFFRYQGLRGRAFYLEGLLDSFEVLQLLPERYDGERFCGYESINHSFSTLRPILFRENQDWKAALMAVKGVYLIMDTTNGKTYVGSAYGDAGIWSRLCGYVSTGHGWNDELVRTINEKGIPYALANFKFSILEVFAFNASDEVILEREAHWKNVMLSRQFGYNKN
ncbi:MAG: GIY-YIG nuclease family protein [Verrucomicrobiota bacterium]